MSATDSAMSLHPAFYFSRLHTNVKGEIDVRLTRKVVFEGPNASHKSGLVAALALLSGHRPDDVGGVASAMMELAPPGAKELFVCGELLPIGRPAPSPPASVDFRIRGTTARASSPVVELSGLPNGVHAEDVGAFLLDFVGELMRKEPKRQRAAILRAVAPPGLKAAIRQVVPEAHRSELERYLADAEGETEADQVVNAADTIRKAGLAQSKAGKLASTAPDDPAETAAVPTDDDVSKMRTRLDVARGVAERVKQRNAAGERHHAIRTVDLPRVEEQRRLALDTRAAAESAAGLPDRAAVETASSALAAARALLKVMIPAMIARTETQGAEARIRCLCCRRPASAAELETATQMLDADAVKVAAAQAQLAAAPAQVTAGAVENCDKKIAALRAELAEIEKMLIAPPPAAGEDPATVDAELRQAEEVRAAHSTRMQARKEAATQAAKADITKSIGRAVDRVVLEVLHQSIADFEARASTALADGRAVKVQLFDGNKAVCRVGVAKDGVMRSWRVLSGAERVRLAAAFSAAWATTVASPVRAIVVDEVWLNSRSMLALAAGIDSALDLTDGPTQAFICAVELAPDTREALRSSGWTVIQLPDRELAAMNGAGTGNGAGQLELAAAAASRNAVSPVLEMM